jgi:hypothetical protein
MTPSYSELLNTCSALIDELHTYKVANPSHDEDVITKARAVIIEGRRHNAYRTLMAEAIPQAIEELKYADT